MQETELAGPTDAFLQGDIIKVVDPAENFSFPPYGIIINADCDIAHCKVDGVLSFVPLLPFEMYFRTFWVPSFIETRRVELLDSIGQLCGLGLHDCQQLEEWIREDGVGEVVSRLAKAYRVKSNAISSKLT